MLGHISRGLFVSAALTSALTVITVTEGWAKPIGSTQAACTCTCQGYDGQTQTKLFTLAGHPLNCSTYSSTGCILTNSNGSTIGAGYLKDCSGHVKTSLTGTKSGVAPPNTGSGVFANPR
jgi:hypothetical protein